MAQPPKNERAALIFGTSYQEKRTYLRIILEVLGLILKLTEAESRISSGYGDTAFYR